MKAGPRVAMSVWREMLVRSWRLDPRLTAFVSLLIVAQIGAFSISGLAMRAVIDNAADGGGWALAGAAIAGGLGFALAGIGAYAQFELRSDIADRIGYLQIDPQVQRQTAALKDLEHLERSEYLDRLSMVRGKGQALAESGWSVPETAALIAQLAVTLIILATVHPALLLLALFAAPAVFLNPVAHRRIGAATLASAGNARLERHLHDLLTRPAAGKEIRVCGAAETLIDRADEAWRDVSRVRTAARRRASMIAAASSILFVAGYAGGLVFVATLVDSGRRGVGDLVLAIVLAGQLRGEFQRVQYNLTRVQTGFALAAPYRWLTEYADAHLASPGAPAPARLDQGIGLRGVTFGYPGTHRVVLGPLDLDLPAGSLVALVGEHGSGKSTLVKLLCGFYRPDSGAITVDAVPLDRIGTTEWWASTSAAFQDFARYEVTVAQGVGFGDLAAIDDEERLRRALRDAGAQDLERDLPEGLASRLGQLFGGVDLSEGQWQKVALARACVRRAPLLVVLDEPTASLDAPSEDAIFKRHAALARRLGSAYGTITLIVSHRFSTVRVADLIMVLEGGKIVERGAHDDLVKAGGTYAELYEIQRRAYAG